jgi:hypothetical protein
VIGVVLLGGVVGWKLLGSTYRADLEAICNAEQGSGFTIQKDTPKVTAWIRAHLATAEGNELFSSLSDARLVDRAKRLKEESSSRNVAPCPMIASYERLAAEGEYRGDLQHACSSMTFPRLAELDDGARLDKIEEWVDTQAKSPRTKELAAQLQRAPAPERGKVLRDTAGNMDVFSCEVAKILESPQAPPKPSGPPQVRVTAAPQVIGSLREDDLGKALAEATPALNECYKKGLDRKPDLAGKMAVKIQVDPDGKVIKATPVELSVDDHDSVVCIVDVVKAIKLPKNGGPLASALVPLELSTRP